MASHTVTDSNICLSRQIDQPGIYCNSKFTGLFIYIRFFNHIGNRNRGYYRSSIIYRNRIIYCRISILYTIFFINICNCYY